MRDHASILGCSADQVRNRKTEQYEPTQTQPTRWSDEVETHETHLSVTQDARSGRASDPSSEDSGRWTSLEHSTTTPSTSPALLGIQELEPPETKKAGALTKNSDESGLEESVDDVNDLPQRSEIQYKHPRYSRRVQSRSEPSGTSHQIEAVELSDGEPHNDSRVLNVISSVSCASLVYKI